jgi:hypothetical protein
MLGGMTLRFATRGRREAVLADVKASDLKGGHEVPVQRGLQVNGRVPGVRLADAVELVRSELREARERGSRRRLLCAQTRGTGVEVVFDATAGADVGVRVWVVSLGAKGEVSARSDAAEPGRESGG